MDNLNLALVQKPIQQSTQESLAILDIAALKETSKFITMSLNRSCKEGVFNMDESYLLKVSLHNIDKCVETLENYQKFVNDLKNKTIQPTIN
jgi:hypothetical protein